MPPARPRSGHTGRAQIATRLLNEISRGSLTGLIARSADFYGPGVRTSVANLLLAESDSTWNQTLHVPTASSPRTGKEFMEGVMNLTDSERIELRRQATARNGRADAARALGVAAVRRLYPG